MWRAERNTGRGGRAAPPDIRLRGPALRLTAAAPLGVFLRRAPRLVFRMMFLLMATTTSLGAGLAFLLTRPLGRVLHALQAVGILGHRAEGADLGGGGAEQLFAGRVEHDVGALLVGNLSGDALGQLVDHRVREAERQ